jgi:hypothetical protein
MQQLRTPLSSVQLQTSDARVASSKYPKTPPFSHPYSLSSFHFVYLFYTLIVTPSLFLIPDLATTRSLPTSTPLSASLFPVCVHPVPCYICSLNSWQLQRIHVAIPPTRTRCSAHATPHITRASSFLHSLAMTTTLSKSRTTMLPFRSRHRQSMMRWRGRRPSPLLDPGI